MVRGVLFIFILLLQSAALAEYRVFRLKIDKMNPDGTIASTREALSVLDPRQYRGYYPVAPNERVLYTQTWRCYGRTDQFKSFCEPPPAGGPSPASATISNGATTAPESSSPPTDQSPEQKP